jgi:hypothetical protein
MENEVPTRGRPLTADGRRKLVSARVSEAQFAAIEAARGGMPRSEWVEAAINAYLSPVVRELFGALDAPPIPVYGNTGDAGHAGTDADSVYGNDEPERPPCRHPADQVDPDAGVCHGCGADVW